MGSRYYAFIGFVFLLLILTSTGAFAGTINHIYDYTGQLLSTEYAGSSKIEYAYDVVGNRLAKTITLTGEPANNPPSVPSNPVPANSAVNVDRNITLSWSGGDSDSGDLVFYDIYFGTTLNPPLYMSGYNTTIFTINNLQFSTDYYWKIVARDNHNATSDGPLWSFSTKLDTDGDEVPDLSDNCLNTINPDQLDTDGDGIGNACDSCPNDAQNDQDNDGICGDIDNCPAVSNADQLDSDGEGIGDVCDICPNDAQNDQDNDDLCGNSDNCPTVSNADQLDSNNDGVGDVCTVYQCISSSTEFQQALTTAETNNLHDIIMLQQGTYNILNNNWFNFVSNDPHGLTIEGGYADSCKIRYVDPKNTILNGNNSNMVLQISYSSTYDRGLVKIDGISITNGLWKGAHINFYSKNGKLVISNNNISFNHTHERGLNSQFTVEFGCGLSVSGGGPTRPIKVEFTNNIFSNNIFSNQYYPPWAGGTYIDIYGDISLQGNLFSDNRARWYGGAYLIAQTGNIKLENNRIIHNAVDYYNGSYTYVGGLSANATYDIIANNNVIANNLATSKYGGIYLRAGTMTLTNNTITANHAYYDVGGLYASCSAGNFYNNIIWGNIGNLYGDALVTCGTSAAIFNNDFDPAKALFGTNAAMSGNLNVDPMFIDLDSGDYHISQNSPLRNAGYNSAPSLPSEDYEGDSRIIGSTVDIGADEYNPVTASFTALPLHGVDPLTVNFTDTSTSTEGTIVSWAWDLNNDGIIDSITQNPAAVYTEIGNYSVKLTATDSNGNSNFEVKNDYIEVGIDTDNDGFIDNRDNCPSTSNPDQTDLDNDEIGDACDNYIDLLNQSISVQSLSSETASESSSTYNYDVTSLMKDTYSVIPVRVQKLSKKYDILSFRSNIDANQLSSMTLSVDVSGLYHNTPQSARIYAYNADADSVNTSQYLTFTLYSGWNDLDVTQLLSLMDSFGFVKFRITISRNWVDIAEAYFTATPTGLNHAPIAEANGPYTGTTGNPVIFSSNGTSDPDGDALSFLWNFGDGQTSTQASPSHTYTSAGTFNVTLTATDTYGSSGSDTATATITVPLPNQPPVANAGPDKTGVIRTNISFSGSGSYDPDGTISSYAWNFGDGTTGSGVNVTHKYTKTGTFTVTLTVTDNNGATAQDTAIVTITK